MAAKDEGAGSKSSPAGNRDHSTLDHPPWSNIAYHLSPCSSWEAAQEAGEVRPEGFEAEGFVHLTLGLDQLLVPANRYHARDLRPHVALTVDLDAVACEVRFDAEPPLYPHAYGPLPLAAIREVRAALRDPSGRFVAWGPPEPP